MTSCPWHDRIVVCRIEADDTTADGIIIPNTAKERPLEGEVIAGALGPRNETGQVQPLDPNVGVHRKAMLEDMAILIAGATISNLTLDMLGRARKVSIEKENTTIVVGAGRKEEIQGRIMQINTSDYRHEKLQERLAKLASSAKEKKGRVDDALHRAEVEEGVLPSGGVAVLRATRALDDAAFDNSDQKTGGEIVVRRAIEAPARHARSWSSAGWNAQTNEFSDLFSQGVIDPAEVPSKRTIDDSSARLEKAA
ncbi:MAG: hypothetical protein EOR89_23440 [Mesorhizobium sp.]|nr:MAG: hypothetical protein EOR89_23440 [Mesorhizobium sp.]